MKFQSPFDIHPELNLLNFSCWQTGIYLQAFQFLYIFGHQFASEFHEARFWRIIKDECIGPCRNSGRIWSWPNFWKFLIKDRQQSPRKCLILPQKVLLLFQFSCWMADFETDVFWKTKSFPLSQKLEVKAFYLLSPSLSTQIWKHSKELPLKFKILNRRRHVAYLLSLCSS